MIITTGNTSVWFTPATPSNTATAPSKTFKDLSTKIILIKGRKEDITKISKNEANPLIQTIKIYPFKQYLNNFKKNQFKIEKVKLPKKKYSKKAINLWVVSDNLLKGAALNTVQILETLIKK